MKYLYLCTLLFPFLSSLIILKTKNEKSRNIITLLIVSITSLLVWTLILNSNDEVYSIISFTDKLEIKMGYDSLGKFFAGIVATLYPLTTIYSFEYMNHDHRTRLFYFFFILAYGVTIGITLSRDLFTLYCFYELLTLTTMPLVLHNRDEASSRAARVYLYLSIGGASLAFASMLYVVVNDGVLVRNEVTQLFYLLGFLGFGVKAAVFPFHIWLPRASVAPTPVTALLHAVAVVKSGVFAIIRLTYYVYGVDNLIDSFGQYIPMIIVLFTILYGSIKAVRQSHIKRKMAYSTVANLSYILFAVLLMSETGLQAGLIHMANHAQIKILLFFVVGAIMHTNNIEYVDELDGLASKMPITFACYLIGALALIGIPPLSGFISKFYLISAGLDSNTTYSIMGIIILLISALLTAIYTLIPLRHAYFPDKSKDLSKLVNYREAGKLMLIPMIILMVSIIVTGLFSSSIVNSAFNIASTIGGW